MDGKFFPKSLQLPIIQIFTIGTRSNNSLGPFTPRFIALLDKSDAEIYLELLHGVKILLGEEITLSSIMADFEGASRLAARTVFQERNIKLYGCAFHYEKNISDYAASLGLTCKYRKASSLKAVIHAASYLDLTDPSIYALYVSVLTDEFEKVKTNDSAALDKLAEYLCNTYLRFDSIYPPSTWSADLARQASQNVVDATNNSVESWHACLTFAGIGKAYDLKKVVELVRGEKMKRVINELSENPDAILPVQKRSQKLGYLLRYELLRRLHEIMKSSADYDEVKKFALETSQKIFSSKTKAEQMLKHKDQFISFVKESERSDYFLACIKEITSDLTIITPEKEQPQAERSSSRLQSSAENEPEERRIQSDAPINDQLIELVGVPISDGAPTTEFLSDNQIDQLLDCGDFEFENNQIVIDEASSALDTLIQETSSEKENGNSIPSESGLKRRPVAASIPIDVEDAQSCSSSAKILPSSNPVIIIEQPKMYPQILPKNESWKSSAAEELQKLKLAIKKPRKKKVKTPEEIQEAERTKRKKEEEKERKRQEMDKKKKQAEKNKKERKEKAERKRMEIADRKRRNEYLRSRKDLKKRLKIQNSERMTKEREENDEKEFHERTLSERLELTDLARKYNNFLYPITKGERDEWLDFDSEALKIEAKKIDEFLREKYHMPEYSIYKIWKGGDEGDCENSEDDFILEEDFYPYRDEESDYPLPEPSPELPLSNKKRSTVIYNRPSSDSDSSEE